MHTIIANIKHAIRNREQTTIGGGEFSPEELAEFLKHHEALTQAAAEALEALTWAWGGEPMASLEMKAIGSLKKVFEKEEKQNDEKH